MERFKQSKWISVTIRNGGWDLSSLIYTRNSQDSGLAKVEKKGKNELLPPPYSPDLASRGFYLLPKLKAWLGGKRINDNTEVIAAVNGYFEGIDVDFYKNSILAFEYRWEKCIALDGENVEK